VSTYFGAAGSVGTGWFGRVGSPVCGVALIGGVTGMLGGAALGAGFTAVSGMVVAGSLAVAGAVAAVSVDMPVVAWPVEAEPAHQSLLARVLAEAFV
jgi:hypothetical protein